MEPLLDMVLREIPGPAVRLDAPLQMLVTTLDWSEYVGRIAVGRIQSGSIQQGQSIVTYSSIIGHYHDIIKEFVHRCLQGGELAQRVGVVMVLKQWPDDRLKFADRGRQRLFGRLLQQSRIITPGYSGLRLTQDVADAFVCRGQAGRFDEPVLSPSRSPTSSRSSDPLAPEESAAAPACAA